MHAYYAILGANTCSERQKKNHEFFKGKIFTPGVIICTSLSE